MRGKSKDRAVDRDWLGYNSRFGCEGLSPSGSSRYCRSSDFSLAPILTNRHAQWTNRQGRGQRSLQNLRVRGSCSQPLSSNGLTVFNYDFGGEFKGDCGGKLRLSNRPSASPIIDSPLSNKSSGILRCVSHGRCPPLASVQN